MAYPSLTHRGSPPTKGPTEALSVPLLPLGGPARVTYMSLEIITASPSFLLSTSHPEVGGRDSLRLAEKLSYYYILVV